MEYSFLGFWLYIIVDVVLVFLILGWWVWNEFLDTRLRLHIIKQDKQIKFIKRKIINDTVTYLDKETGNSKTYTINRNFIYFKGRIPHTFYWNNNPIPIDITQDTKLTKEEKNSLTKILKKLEIPITFFEPTKFLNKRVQVDTAETFFRVLYTNLTLNLLKPPKDLQKAIKYTTYFIIGGIIIALILHFTGVINIMEFTGAKPPAK